MSILHIWLQKHSLLKRKTPSSSITIPTIIAGELPLFPSNADPSRVHPLPSPSLSFLYHQFCFNRVTSISSTTSYLWRLFSRPTFPSLPLFPWLLEKLLKKFLRVFINPLSTFCSRQSWIYSKMASFPLNSPWNWSREIANNLCVTKSNEHFLFLLT